MVLTSVPAAIGSPDPGTYTFELVRDRAQFAHWQRRLRVLCDTPGIVHRAVQTPEWIAMELEVRGDKAAPALVVAMRDGEVAGYAPLLLQHGRTAVPLGNIRLPLRTGHYLRMLGSDVVARASDAPAVRELAARAIRSHMPVGVIHLQETALPSAFGDAIISNDPRYRAIHSNLVDQVIWSIEAPGSLDAYLSGFSSKTLSARRRRSRAVHRDLDGKVTIEVFEQPGQVEEYCRHLDHVYGRSWHAQSLAIAWSADPLRSALRDLASKGCLVGYVLKLDDHPIAFVHGYHVAGVYEVDNLAYDEAFGRHGVGSMLMFEALLDFFSRHPSSGVDFGYGHNDYKRVFSRQNVPAGSLLLARGPAAVSLRMTLACSRLLRRLVVAGREMLRRGKQAG